MLKRKARSRLKQNKRKTIQHNNKLHLNNNLQISKILLLLPHLYKQKIQINKKVLKNPQIPKIKIIKKK